MKRTIIGSATAALLLAGGVASAAPANADVIGANNLVNVQVTNVLNNNQVALQIPINAAANVCGVSVGVLTSGLLSGPVTCTSRSGNQTLSITK